MSEIPERVDLPSGLTIWIRNEAHTYWAEYDKSTGKCSGRITGVSTVAKAINTNADPLITWGAKLEAEGICGLLAAAPEDEREAMLSRGGEALHRELVAAKMDWRGIRDARATEGTNVHEKVFAALGRGERPSLAHLSALERGYGQAAFRFWRELGPSPIAVEQVVYLPECEVAGRFDLLAYVGDEVVLFDAKTSKDAYLSHHVQLAAYALGCEASGLPGPDGTVIVLLRPTGSYELVEGVGEPEDFEAAHAAYLASKRIGKAQRVTAKREKVAA